MKPFVGGAILALSLISLGSSALADQGTLTIGVLTDLSGPLSETNGQGSVVASEMAVEDFGGEVNGRKIRVIAADHQNKADVASAIARKWFDVEGVDVIVDSPNSAIALAVNTIANERNKAFLATGPATSDLTGSQCTNTTVHWTYDSWMLGHATGTAMVDLGFKDWYFMVADYAFGRVMEKELQEVVEEKGGTVVGRAHHPISNADFSSFLLQAQASGAKVIGLLNAGTDTINSIKQAHEFNITDSGQSLVSLVLTIVDVHALSLEVAKGLIYSETFYWDLNEKTREWSKRYAERLNGKMPNMLQAGAYAAVLHYLKAVDAADSVDGGAVVDKMKEIPTSDPLFGEGSIRVDGRKLHPVYILQVKGPEESAGAWDYAKVVATVPAEKAFRPLEAGGCSLVK